MQTRIGFDHYTIAHRGFTAAQTLEFAQGRHHFDGVQFLEPGVDRRGSRRTPAGSVSRPGAGNGALSRGGAAVAESGPTLP